ncbi:superoxide dismutase family protein [Acinetobacter sp. ANC 5054]|uniref:superoxide dismutase family protein n=1 Tax=Acinetobacter sp. ANC 5054 TaxID=1977877 RepID=UPI00148ACFE0
MSSLFKLSALAAISAFIFTGCANTPTSTGLNAKTVTVNAVSAQGVGPSIGQIQLIDSPAGLVINTNLSQLPPGPHGFHIHEKGSCSPAEKDGKAGAALAAGGHFNPKAAPNHGTPLTGHMGDLPILQVQTDGTAKVNLIAPRLKLADVQGLAIMVHAGGDNYSDDPKPLGGGGDRIACGVIK